MEEYKFKNKKLEKFMDKKIIEIFMNEPKFDSMKDKKQRLKRRSKKALKKKLWKVFSIYIRKKDDGQCYTCSSKKPWKSQDAGHYIPTSICGEYLWFNDLNVHCQCTSCNRFKHGNLSVYAEHLTTEYGDTIIKKLGQIKKEHRTMPYSEMLKLYEKYNALQKA